MTELEKQNAIRERNGMLPLTELPKSPEEEKAEKEAAAKLEAEKKEKEAADAELEKKRKEEEEKQKNTPAPAEIDDDIVLAYLQKNKGLKVKSFDDLKHKPTEEEIKAEQEEREAAKLSWAFKNKKVKKDEFENFIADSKNPQSLIFNSYAAKVKSFNPDITDEDLQTQFKERYGLDKDPESWEYKHGQEELNLMTSQILGKKYGHIMGIENEYSAYEKAQNEQQSVQAKIIANAPAYKKDIETVFSGVKSYKTTIDGEEYEIPLPTDFIDRTKNYFLQDDTAASHIQKGWSKEEITDLVNNMTLIENREYINKEIAIAYNKSKQKGTRGIAPPLTRRTVSEITMDEKQKKAAERHGAVTPATAN